MKTKYLFLLSFLFIINALSAQKVINGAEQMETLLPLLGSKRVALVVNQTSIIGNVHLLDTLLASNINKKKYLRPNTDSGEMPMPAKQLRTAKISAQVSSSNHSTEKTRNPRHNRCRTSMWWCSIFRM